MDGNHLSLTIAKDLLLNLNGAAEKVQGFLPEVSRFVMGHDDLKELLLVALIAEGHVLVEGPPGSAKTTLCKTFAAAIGGDFKRLQCTPDMAPADIVGFYLYRPDGSSNFVPGPIFANVLLVDELNRATPRTQSAFLEAMQEQQVTVEGQTSRLPRPFTVIASQVPMEREATYRLPATQLDRFMFRLQSSYPGPDEERAFLSNIDAIIQGDVHQVFDLDTVVHLQQQAKMVRTAPEVVEYVVELCQRLRNHPDVVFGPSPRGTVGLFKGARAYALVLGREYVIPDDVRRLALPALTHRIVVTPEAEADGLDPADLVWAALDEIPVPK